METNDTSQKPQQISLENSNEGDQEEELKDFVADGLNIDDQNPYEDQKPFEEEDDELANYDLNKDLEVPKMVRKNSANIYTARVVRMFNKKLQDWCRFSGLTGVRTVSDELTDSSYFDADSD